MMAIVISTAYIGQCLFNDKMSMEKIIEMIYRIEIPKKKVLLRSDLYPLLILGQSQKP